jgi:transposase
VQRFVSVPPTLRAGSIKMKQYRNSPRASYDCILAQKASCLLMLSPLCTRLEERMAKKGKKNTPTPEIMPMIHPHAAGIDVGAEEHWVCVPADRDAQPIQKFSAFTCDLHRLADWLTACRITTVVMESTGVYWIPLFQILETRGFAVALVNARHVKNVPGRPKTDRFDCRWLQRLHSYGLLAPSFRPPEDVCRLRSLLRHRENLIQMTVKHIQHMQKSLDQMNLHLHHVISDVTGVTGMRIIRAIVAGERDPGTLAQYRDYRIKSSPETIAKALEGDYRPEHVFTLTQSLALYDFTQQQVAACDQEIERVLGTFASLIDPDEHPLPPPTTAHRQPQRNEPAFDLRAHLYRITGVDLTQVPGLQALTIHTVLSEVGLDMSKWPTDKHFASWLGLCPDNRISGGKVLSTGSRRVQNRASRALRMAAQSLRTSPSYLGAFYRRMRSKLGPAKATTATAHKLAKIIYHMLQEQTPYREHGAEHYLHKDHERKLRQLRKQAKHLGFALVPQASN